MPEITKRTAVVGAITCYIGAIICGLGVTEALIQDLAPWHVAIRLVGAVGGLIAAGLFRDKAQGRQP